MQVFRGTVKLVFSFYPLQFSIIILCIVAAVCLLTDPPKKGPAFAVVSCPEPTGGESGILLTMYEVDSDRNADRTWKWTYRFEGLTPREVDRYAMPQIRNTVDIKIADLGDDSILYGDLALIKGL